MAYNYKDKPVVKFFFVYSESKDEYDHQAFIRPRTFIQTIPIHF
jgi:hypothetical protein